MRQKSWRPALARASIAGLAAGVTILGMSAPALADPGGGNAQGCVNGNAVNNNPNCANVNAGGQSNNQGGQGQGQGQNQNQNQNANGPAGNNGTVKIHEVGTPAPDHANQPMIDSCSFAVDFFDFDADQGGGQPEQMTMVFAALPPSGHGEELARVPATGVESDPAGGGQDNDGQMVIDASTWDFTGLTVGAHGYHIKLSLLTNEPGGVKHKVFWLNCTPTNQPGGGISGTSQSNLSVCKAAISTITHPQPRFTFAVTNGTPRSFTVQAGGNCETVTPDKNATTVTVTEQPKQGFALQGITVNPSSLETARNGSSVTVDVTQPNVAAVVTVTYRNAEAGVSGNNAGSVQVCKVGNGDVAGKAFDFDLTGLSSNTVTLHPANRGEDCSTAFTVTGTNGHVTIDEGDTPGFTVDNIDVSNNANNVVTDKPTGRVTFDVPEGEAVTVTFTNVKTEVGGGNTQTPGGIVTPPTTVPPTVTPPTAFPFPPGTVLVPPKVVNNRPATEVLGEKFTRSAPTEVAAAGATNATTLPFTGASNTGVLLGSGLGALLGGALLMAAGRWRRTT